MRRLNINGTFELANSFVSTIVNNAGGDLSRIEFAFNYYGKFVDMGVGRGVKLGDARGNRRPKKWYSKTFYAEVKKLGELVAAKYAQKAQIIIVESVKTT